MFKLALCSKLASTQIALIDAVKHGLDYENFALATLAQYAGIGSNNRSWIGDDFKPLMDLKEFKINEFKDLSFVFFDNFDKFNLDINANLYLSFYSKNIPSDLPMQSISIYYAMILKLVLKEFGSAIFVKWPNDLYLKNKKIGGIISTKIKDKIICGIGLNIVSSPSDADVLDIKINLQILFKAFFDKVMLNLSWREIFNYYKDDFALNEPFYFKQNDKIYSLSDAKLYSDGSILIDDKRIYSLR